MLDAKQIENIAKYVISEVSYGYHSGDLGKSSSDGLYGQGASRHTGHFGSGTYFFGNRSAAGKYGGGNRPTHEVDFDRYGLFRPRTAEEGMKLHDFLEKLNTEFVRYPESAPLSIEVFEGRFKYLENTANSYANSNKQISRGDFNHFMKRAYSLEDYGYWRRFHTDLYELVNSKLRYGWPRPEIMESVVEHLSKYNIRRQLEDFLVFPAKWSKWLSELFQVPERQVVNLIFDCRDYFLSHDKRRDSKLPQYQGDNQFELYRDIDSCSTFFMKSLGYNGIDVRGYENLDNGMYGSVIYDLGNKLHETRDNLRTRRGSTVNRDRRYGVGKHIGGEYYFHVNYLPRFLDGGYKELFDQARALLTSNQETAAFQYNIVVLPDKVDRGYVKFVRSPGFDTEREPLRGVGYKVDVINGTIRRLAGDNTIYHHKWTFVDDDYTGFDVNGSYNWSGEWLGKLDEPANGTSMQGWRNQLEKYGLQEVVRRVISEMAGTGGSQFSDEELLNDYGTADSGGLKDKKALAAKYGIESAKATDLKNVILIELRKNRGCKSEFTIQDIHNYTRLGVPELYKKLVPYLDEESPVFLEYLRDYYMEELKRRRLDRYAGPNVQLGHYMLSAADKYIINRYRTVNQYLTEKTDSYQQERAHVKSLETMLLEKTKPFKDYLLKLTAEQARKEYKKAPAELEKVEKLLSAAKAKLSGIGLATREERWQYEEQRKTVNQLNTNLCRLKEVVESTEEEHVAKRVKTAEELYLADIKELAERLKRYNLDLTNTEISAMSNDPKLFELHISDGVHRLHARSILAAVNSTYMVMHYRYIITNER